MKRIIVFPVVGPVLGLCAVLLISMMLGNWDFKGSYLGLGFFLVLAIIPGLVDGALSDVAPISIRLPITALCGAVVCAGILSVGASSLTVVLRCMLISAVCMGICSWLSNKPKRSVNA
jgi:hypothetical protein